MGSVIQDEKSVSILSTAVILPLFMYAGLFKNSGNLPDWIGWIQYISPVKYAFLAFV